MNISKNAITVLEKRYLTRDKQGNIIETIDELFLRVAQTIAIEDKKYNKDIDIDALSKQFYDLMTQLDFLPNSPTLMNAGKPLGQLSACFVLPIADSMEEIFDSVKNAALIHKSDGGTGFSFSRIRPNGATVNSTGGIASGPISFMKVFNSATEAVKQGGTRRGANMAILRIDHPDILEFINCKNNSNDLNNFNISIGITEKFMEAVEEKNEYELIDPKTKDVTGKLKASEVYDKIVDSAWKNGEPGIIFLDRLNKHNVTPTLGEIESTNPCGEQPLLPYESCNLGSINLSNMLTKNEKDVDYEKLANTVGLAVHFLDNVIDANKYPLDIIDKTTKQSRKIGLGVMGFSDLLLKLKIPYGSQQSLIIAERIMSFIQTEGRKMSIDLAKQRGAFPLFNQSTLKDGAPIRNATITTIAPTGTLSMIGSCSSGIEPVFAYSYIKNVMNGTELIETNPILKEDLINRGIYTDDLMKKITKQGSLSHINEIPSDIKDIYVSSHDISPEAHIMVQAAFQKYTDNAVSKTVNFKNHATKEDVDKVYKLAYKTGCKGVTIYRDGSRFEQVLNIGKVNKEEKVQEDYAVNKYVPRKRPTIVNGFTEKVAIGCGNLYITVNFDDKGIVEVFTNTGKGGGCPSQSEATSRLVSVSLRSGVDTQTIIEQLKGIRCVSTIGKPDMKATSCPDAIARVIQNVLKMQNNFGVKLKASEVIKKELKKLDKKFKFCPECAQSLEHEGGCVICKNCGYSKCG